MKSPLELAFFVLAMAAATQVTRFLPFLLPPSWLERPWIKRVKEGLPVIILLLLVVYSLKETAFLRAPWGIPEISALVVVLSLHFWKRNALLSIGCGTALYMIIVQNLSTKGSP